MSNVKFFDIDVRVMKLSANATMPKYSREGDVGLDLYTAKDIVIMPYETIEQLALTEGFIKAEDENKE